MSRSGSIGAIGHPSQARTQGEAPAPESLCEGDGEGGRSLHVPARQTAPPPARREGVIAKA